MLALCLCVKLKTMASVAAISDLLSQAVDEAGFSTTLNEIRGKTIPTDAVKSMVIHDAFVSSGERVITCGMARIWSDCVNFFLARNASWIQVLGTPRMANTIVAVGSRVSDSITVASWCRALHWFVLSRADADEAETDLRRDAFVCNEVFGRLLALERHVSTSASVIWWSTTVSHFFIERPDKIRRLGFLVNGELVQALSRVAERVACCKSACQWSLAFCKITNTTKDLDDTEQRKRNAVTVQTVRGLCHVSRFVTSVIPLAAMWWTMALNNTLTRTVNIEDTTRRRREVINVETVSAMCRVVPHITSASAAEWWSQAFVKAMLPSDDGQDTERRCAAMRTPAVITALARIRCYTVTDPASFPWDAAAELVA